MTTQEAYNEILKPMRGVFSPPPHVAKDDEAAVLEEYADALKAFDVRDLREGWKSARNSHTRAFWIPVGTLVEACAEARHDRHESQPKRDGASGRQIEGQFQPWGGACQCSRCTFKPAGHGFFRASNSDHERAAALRRELDDHLWKRMYGPGAPPVPDFTGEEVHMTPERARQVIAATAQRLSWNGEPDPKRLTEGPPKQKRWHTDEEIAAIRRAAIEKNSPAPGRTDDVAATID